MERHEPLNFNPIYHNQVVYKVQTLWNRPLNDHEKHLAALVHDIVRTEMEAEEIKILDVK